MSDLILVLGTTLDCAARKSIGISKGMIYVDPYPRAYEFKPHVREVNGIDDLSNLLEEIIELESKNPHFFIVRGLLRPGINHDQNIKRRIHDRPGEKANIVDVPQPWVMLDIDKLTMPPDMDPSRDPEYVVKYVLSLLPLCFQNVTTFWQFSASQNMPRKEEPFGSPPPRVIKLHLFFWLNRRVSNLELKQFFRSWEAVAIDLALFNAVQPHYLLPPEFRDGLEDPLPRRHGVLQGEGEVDVVEFPSVEIKTSSKSKKRSEPRQTQKSPRGISRSPTVERGTPLPRRKRERIEGALATIPAVKYQTWLYMLMALKSTGTSDAFEIADQWSQSAPGKYDPHEMDRTWESIGYIENGIGLGTLFYLARQHGWKDRRESALIPDVPCPYGGGEIPPSRIHDTLTGILEAHFNEAKEYTARSNSGSSKDESAPAIALDVPPGGSKTTTTLRYAVQNDARIEVYVENHDMGEELKSFSIAEGAEARLLQGRARSGVCTKYKLVRELQGEGIINLRELTCTSYKTAAEGGIQECQDIDTCEYYRQWSSTEQVRILPHVYLNIPRGKDEPTPDVVVVDENCLSTLMMSGSWKLDTLLKSSDDIVREVGQLLAAGQPLLPGLLDRWTPEELTSWSETTRSPPPLSIRPRMSWKLGLTVLESEIKGGTLGPTPNDFRALKVAIKNAISQEDQDTESIWLEQDQGDQDNQTLWVNTATIQTSDRLKGIPLVFLDGTMDIHNRSKVVPPP